MHTDHGVPLASGRGTSWKIQEKVKAVRDEEVVVAIIAIACGTLLVFALLNRIAAVAKKWIETALKRDMVARGYTADEIIAVVQSGRAADRKVEMGSVPPAKPLPTNIFKGSPLDGFGW